MKKKKNNERIIDGIDFTPISYDIIMKKKREQLLKKFEVENEL